MVDSTALTCAGANDGSITISSPIGGSGSYQYTINGGTSWSTQTNYTGLAASTYDVRIRDANNFSCVTVLSASLIIDEPAGITASVSHTNETCTGDNNGSITITGAIGGSNLFEYSFNGGVNWGTSNNINGLPDGTYSIRVRDQLATVCWTDLGSVTILEGTNVQTGPIYRIPNE
ncbi:MAG: hypothetical protein HC896_09700 [Bacteroidales bacterium]|nr:hypothetical protein [Bacteroidales bacterium]